MNLIEFGMFGDWGLRIGRGVGLLEVGEVRRVIGRRVWGLRGFEGLRIRNMQEEKEA